MSVSWMERYRNACPDEKWAMAPEMAEDAEATRLVRTLCVNGEVVSMHLSIDAVPTWSVWIEGTWVSGSRGTGPTLLAALQALAEAVER